MVTVEKVTHDDFDLVYPLLKTFKNPNISIDDTRKLFANLWGNDENYCGYMLKDDDTVVGFLGLIFHERILSNRTIRFCNLTSWIVEEGFRDKGALLLLPVLRLENYIITNLSPSEKVCEIMKKLKFTLFEKNKIYTYSLPLLGHPVNMKGSCVNIILDKEKIKSKLNDKDSQIFSDHLQLKCTHVLIEKNDDYCYLVITRPVKKKLPFGHIHYISNHDLFFKSFNSLRVLLPFKLKVVSLIMDERYIAGRNVKGYLAVRHNKYYKSNYEDFDDIMPFDNLYSEFPILGF
jgi:hypothetical protein